MAKSDYLEKKLLDHVLKVAAYTVPTNVYVALFTDATTDAGGGTEVVGGSYARQTSTWAAATSGAGATSNTGAISFVNMPAVTVTHVALFDAAAGGNMLYHGPLTAPQAVTAGNTFIFSIGDLDVTEA
jgi:hypothetical protein